MKRKIHRVLLTAMVTISLTACKGGISYEDASGIHQLGVYESGRDGRVYLDAL